MSGECQGPSELLSRDEVTRSPTAVNTAASHVLVPAPEEQTDQPSSPLVPYDPVEEFGFLLQHLASAIKKVGSLSFWHASLLIGSINSVTGMVNGLLQIFIASFYTCMYVTYTYLHMLRHTYKKKYFVYVLMLYYVYLVYVRMYVVLCSKMCAFQVF